MALTVTSGPTSYWSALRDNTDPRIKLKLALEGNSAFSRQATGQSDLIATANTTDNTAASQVLDLTDLGVTFPASKMRKMRVRSKARSDNDVWIQEWEQHIWGNDGTTPVLVGTAKLLNAIGIIAGTPVQYGNCHAAANFDSSDTAVTTTVGTSDVATSSTAGSSLGNIATNTATLTHPVARAGGKRVLGVNASSDVATVTEILSATCYPINSTTMSVYTGDTATPSADGFDDDGRLEVDFYILPPPSVAFVMNSNNVEVHAGHDATDVLDHLIEVWVGDAEDVTVSAV